MESNATRALIWSEGTAPDEVYPNDINATIAEHLNEHERFVAKTVSLDDPDQGVGEDDLEWADVLLWWGHRRHDEVTDDTVDAVNAAVRDGDLGFVALHSGHYARPFKRLIGESGDLGDVRTVDGETERLEVAEADHPIADGVSDFALPQVEMFGEPFDIPEPDSVVLHSTFSEGGEFRSAVTFSVADGRVAYLRPGHEEFRIYHQPMMRRVLANMTEWAAQ